MIRVTRDDDTPLAFETATRVSTDEHNNLEVWGGHDGDALLYVCSAQCWLDVTIESEK